MAWVDNNNLYITLTQVDTREQTVSCNTLSTDAIGANPTDIGVTGCNKRTIYSAFDFKWGFISNIGIGLWILCLIPYSFQLIQFE